MEFCTVAVTQLNEKTADIKTVINAEALNTLLRKRRGREVDMLLSNIGDVMVQELVREFKVEGVCEESMGDFSIRGHKGVTKHGIPFISVHAVVEVLPNGGGLITDLRWHILQAVSETMRDEKPLVGKSLTTVTGEKVVFGVEFDAGALEKSSITEIKKEALLCLEQEVLKEVWKTRV